MAAAAKHLGLDISRTGIRLAQAHIDGNHDLVVDSYVSLDVPEGLISETSIIDIPAVARLISEAYAVGSFTTKSVVASTFGRQQLYLPASFAKVPHAELRKSLQLRTPTDEPLPFSADGAQFDFLPAPDAPVRAGKVSGLLVGASAQIVSSLEQVVSAAGLKLVGIDAGAFALARATQAAVGSVDDAVIVDIGKTNTTVVQASSGTAVSVQLTPDGGDTITDRLMDRLQLTRGAAEKLKTSEDTSAIEAYRGDFEDVLAEVVSDIAWSVEEILHEHQLSQIVLTGGGARTFGIDRAFGDRFRIAVSAPQFADANGQLVSLVAVGLALPGAGVDLRPVSLADRSGLVRTAAVAAAALLVAGAAIGVTGLQSSSAASQLASASEQQQTLEAQLEDVSEAASVSTQLQVLSDARSAATAAESDWSGIFTRLNALTPEGMTISQFTISSFGANAEAAADSEGPLNVAVTTTSETLPDLTSWLNALKSDAGVTSAKVTDSQRIEDTGTYTTSVSVELSPSFTYRFDQSGAAQ